MPRSREGWLSTIRAISEMTEAHGCTKAEAITARVKAFELMYKKGISMRDLMAPVSIVVPQASVTREFCDPARRTAYEYREKHGIRSHPFTKQVFSNERRINPLHSIARNVAICGIACLAVWTIAAVLAPESRGYDNAAGSDYNQTEVNKLAEAHSALRAVKPLKPEQILYSDPSTR
jgi:hypothetical protein